MNRFRAVDTKAGNVIFRQFLHERGSCASYFIGCPSKGVAAVVDPQGEPFRYESIAEQHALRITDIVDTHVHADHYSGARGLAERVGAKLRLGAGTDVDFEYEPLADGEIVEVGNRRLQVIHTPGHTPEHVSLFVDGWFILTGDTLFVGDVGRVDLALETLDVEDLRSRARQLHSSLRKLLHLPVETEVYPGHYAGSTCGRGLDGKTISTIGREKRVNHALTLEIDDFIDFQLSSAPPLPADFENIKRANLGFDDSQSQSQPIESEGGDTREIKGVN